MVEQKTTKGDTRSPSLSAGGMKTQGRHSPAGSAFQEETGRKPILISQSAQQPLQQTPPITNYTNNQGAFGCDLSPQDEAG